MDSNYAGKWSVSRLARALETEVGDGSLYQELIVIFPDVRLSKWQERHRMEA